MNTASELLKTKNKINILNRLSPVFIGLFFCLKILNTQAQPLKVLFLGNSYTYVNDLPKIVSDIATSMGDTLIYDSNTIGGYSFSNHILDSNSINKIKVGGWDYVILQDQSQVPAFQYYDTYDALALCTMIKKYNPCAQAMYYMTWGRKNGDASNCSVWPPVCTYSGMDSLLYMRYMNLAWVSKSHVSPVGALWKYIRQNHPTIDLYQSDESHPSLAGSYAAACCFYTALFKKDPTTITYNYVLNLTDAAIIRNAVKIVVYDSLQNWNFEKELPKANFIYSIGTGINQVYFFNKSKYINYANSYLPHSYLWDFGDGTTSTLLHPTHNYLSDGTYSVTLTESSCDLGQIQQVTYQNNITFCSHNPTVFPNNLTLCPNSSDTLWTQAYDSYQWFSNDGDTIPNATSQYLLPLFEGYYSVLTTKNGCAEMSPHIYVNGNFSIASYYINTVGNLIASDSACAGNVLQLILTPNKPPYPDDETIQWFNNGLPIPFSNNDTLVVNSSGNYSASIYSPYCPDEIIYTSPQLPYTFISCSIPGNIIQLSVIVYPNPSENFIVKINSELVGTNYIVIDIFGRVVRTGKFDKETNNLKMDGINSGVYFLEIEQKNEEVIKLIRK